jgi:membrane-associated phospholipid phosphatase
MHVGLQQGVEALASLNPLTRALAIACAAGLVFGLAALWVGIAWTERGRISLATGARIVALMVLAYLASKWLTRVVIDERPYLVTHTQPLIPVSHDNGFPSDHVLLAAALTASMLWIARSWFPWFVLGTLLVAAGRLGIGAHHTLDVVGSMVIVAVVALLVAAVPLPATWQRPVLDLVRRRPA